MLHDSHVLGGYCASRIPLSLSKQLQEAGLVVARMEPQPDRLPRKVYHVTDEGGEVLLRWLHQPTPYLRLLSVEFLLRLYLFDRLPLPGVEYLAAVEQQVCREQADCFGQAPATAADGFRRLEHEFRQGQREAVIRWLDRCLEALPAGPTAAPPGQPVRWAPHGHAGISHEEGTRSPEI